MSMTAAALASLGRIPCPEPGVYRGVPARTYHQWEAASNSTLRPGERSALHMRLAMLEPIDATKYMDEGTALHCAVLEPHLYNDLVIVREQCWAVKKGDGERCSNEGSRFRGNGHWYCGVKGHDPASDSEDDGTGDYVVLSGESAGNVEACAQAIKDHPEAAALLDGAEFEVSIVWDDPATGVRCKARLDVWNPGLDAIADLKKVQDASPDSFPRDFYNRRYYRQAAMYADAAVIAGLCPVADVNFIAAELEPPQGVAVYPVHGSTLEAGRNEYRALLRLYRDSSTAGEWTGYGFDLDPLELPRWAFDEINHRLMRI